MSINNNLFGGIFDKLNNPIETMNMYDTFYKTKDVKINRTKRKEQPMKMNKARTIEEIEQMLITRKFVEDDTFDDEDNPKFMKSVTMAPGFVYGVDTRQYYPKKNIPVGPGISDMSNM